MALYQLMVRLKLMGMWSTLSLPLLPAPLWPGVVEPDRVLTIGQIELFGHLNCVQTSDVCYIELLEIEMFNHLIACKQMIDV